MEPLKIMYNSAYIHNFKNSKRSLLFFVLGSSFEVGLLALGSTKRQLKERVRIKVLSLNSVDLLWKLLAINSIDSVVRWDLL